MTLLALLLGSVAAQLFGPLPSTAHSTVFGLSDQKPEVWADPRVRALKFEVARLIVPWDAAFSEPERVQRWLDAVAAAGLRPHIVFEHLRSDNCPGSPCTLPTPEEYRHAVAAFHQQWPQVTTFTTWNEVNHFTQPVAGHPEIAARYWTELTAVCGSCTIVGADVLDSRGYLAWLHRFKAAVPSQPRLWGLHNYADVTYGRTTGTDRVLAAVPGEVWVEETGGIVTSREASGSVTFPFDELRAALSIDRAFAIAAARPRITRMYLYHWKANTTADLFDAGLVRPDGSPRRSLERVQANLLRARSQRPQAPPPAVTMRARWTQPGRLELLLRCRRARCQGVAQLALWTRGERGSALRITRLGAGRRYRATATKPTVRLRVALSRQALHRVRAARRRTLAVTLRAEFPANATVSEVLQLPPPRR